MWTLTAVSTVAAVVLTGVLLIRSHRESIRKQLEATATSLIALGISDFEALDDFDQLSVFIEDALAIEKVEKIIRIYNQEGTLAFSSVRLEYDQLPAQIPKLPDRPEFKTLSGRSRQYETLLIPYLIHTKKKPFYLQVAIPLPHYTEIFRILWWQSLLLMGFLMFVAYLFSKQLSRRLMKPVANVAEHLEGLEPSRIEEWRPLSIKGSGQYLESIILGINSLGARTRAAVLEIRKMGRYVAHELRTPLTILQGEAENALMNSDARKEDYVRVLKSSLEEIHRMTETVSTILQISKWERSGAPPHAMVLDLASWIQDIKPRWEKTLGRPLEFIDRSGQSHRIKIDPTLLYHLIDNLLRNVRDHTPDGTPCILELTSEGTDVRISVSDRGPGLPKEVVDALNSRDSALEVTGVGLHLCRKIAKLSRIRLSFSNRPEGGLEGGLKVELRLKQVN